MISSKLSLAAAPILSELIASGHLDLAQDLSSSVSLSENGSPSEKAEALKRIQLLCHIKALGDIHVKGPSWTEWLNWLTILEDCSVENDRQR
jgi:hypothetical protein